MAKKVQPSQTHASLLSRVSPGIRALNPDIFSPAASAGCPPASSKPTARGLIPFRGCKAEKKTGAEAEYELILKAQNPGCDVLFHKYTFKLANDLRYTPDLAVAHPDGLVTFYEVKGGYIHDRAMHKPKVTAETFRHRFFVAQKLNDGWTVTPLIGKIDQ